MPILTSDPNDELERQIICLVDLSLEGEIDNEWEFQFIESMALRLEKGYSFTESQVDKVHELYEKYY